ncbi:MAG: Crp/Fnr family transcriptional regulator [Deltaproteobacteria bacterium]|nr:Crp/Fnr family transcriptional regulator [Deltaproteobacteria bacterium]
MNNQIDFSDIFSRSGWFVGFEEDKLPDIFSFGHRRVYESGVTLFREGDHATKSYMVLKGRLKVSKLHEDGREAIVRYINPGEMTAAVSVLKGKDYPVTAQAIGPSEALEWDRETMLNLMNTYPRIAINLLGIVVERLDDIQTRYLELQTERVEQRIARSLLRIMRQSGRKTSEGILIDFRLSRQDLADYTGTTLYTVSRTLSRWEQKGWTVSSRERIVVTNPHALVSFAETG